MARNYMKKTDTPTSSQLEAKIVLLGDTGVGKTSIALRFTQDLFQSRTNPTIGASFLMKNMLVGEQKIKLQIWDTAGQERFRSLAPMYYRGASAALLVYDLTSSTSFNKVKEWVNELRLNVPEDIIMVVVGNKLDRADKHRELSADIGREYATSVGAAFAEVSAKTNEGIEEVFCEIAKQLLQSRKSSAQPTPVPHGLPPKTGAEEGEEISDSCCT